MKVAPALHPAAIPGAWAVPLFVSGAVVEDVRKGGPTALDRVLLPIVDALKAEYSRNGRPRQVLDALGGIWMSPLLTDRTQRGSVQLARLHQLAADLQLALGPVGAPQALLQAESSIDELSFSESSSACLKVFVDSTLSLAVARKALGATSEAHHVLRHGVSDAQRLRRASPVDVVPLVRQEMMMRQTVKAHEVLAAMAPAYAEERPMEYYRTVKRVFEFLLNNDRVSGAEMLFPEFRRSFLAVASRSSPLSQISFQKNVGQFFAAKGRTREATQVLLAACTSALALGLRGQVMQISGLLERANGGAAIRLVTMSTEMGRGGIK